MENHHINYGNKKLWDLISEFFVETLWIIEQVEIDFIKACNPKTHLDNIYRPKSLDGLKLNFLKNKISTFQKLIKKIIFV